MFRIIFPALPFLIAVIAPALAALAPEAQHQRGLVAYMTPTLPPADGEARPDR